MRNRYHVGCASATGSGTPVMPRENALRRRKTAFSLPRFKEADERTACRRSRPIKRRCGQIASEAGERRQSLRGAPFAKRRGSLEAAGIPGRDALRLPEIAGLPGRRRETFDHVSRFALRHSLAMAHSAILRKRELRGRRQSSGVQIFGTEPVPSHVVRPYFVQSPSLDMILLLVHVSFRLYPRHHSSGTERISCLKGMRTNDLERSANRRRG